MGHIGSEISRAKNWDNEDKVIRNSCLERALQLIDLTKNDPRNLERIEEVGLLYKRVEDIYFERNHSDASLSDLDWYCLEFASVVRKNS